MTVTPLAISLGLHVLIYALLLLTPPWPWPARAGLTAELVPPEAPAPTSTPRLMEPAAQPARRAVPRRSRQRVSPAQAPPVAMPSPQVEPVREPAFAPAVPAVRAESNTTPASSPGPATAVAEEPTGPFAVSTAPGAFGMPAPAASSTAPAVAALPPGEGAREAIPRGGYQVKPTYPSTPRRLGIEGTVLLGVLVDATGRVGDVVVRRSGGHADLDRAAADAVRQWQFEPARRGVEAIAMWVEIPVQFRLR